MPIVDSLRANRTMRNLQPKRVTIYDLPVGSMPYSTRDEFTGVIVQHEPVDRKPEGSADSVVDDTSTPKKGLSTLQMAGIAFLIYRVFLK